jgi:microcystin degradation protein MlrC
VSENQDQNQKRWVVEAEDALNRAGEALKSAWEQTRDARMTALETAKEAANRLTEAIDQGIEVAKQTWDPSTSGGVADGGESGPPPIVGLEEEE